ncbi:MAG: GDP-mannose 4,6-dehydratase, partial [Ignavibacteria bacterium]|nr:GDP-mannose 4,6-dehydratase [Ignavibacteria bacterium]
GLTTDIIYNLKPDEIYHLGAQSHVRVSFDMPEYTGNVTGLATTRMLEALRRSGVNARFYQASSSEMFGSAPLPQNELTPLEPRSPYAIAKVYAYWMARNYRDAYKMFVSNGILFNHESPRRGETFVSRKITRAVANILSGKQRKLYLGNLDAKRDWGFAPDYVEGMWLMLQTAKPDDYVMGTGESNSVRQFVEAAMSYAGIEIEWRGVGREEKGLVESCDAMWSTVLKPGDVLIEIDPKYFRPTEVDSLQADIGKANSELHWFPRVSFSELVKIMIDYDFLAAGLDSRREGIEALKSKNFEWTGHQFSVHERIREFIG